MISSFLSYCLVTILIAIPVSISFELPFLQTCTIDDEPCFAEQVNKFFQLYGDRGNGIEVLDLPSLDPMHLGNITINGNSNDNFNFQLIMQDAELYKFPKVTILSMKGFKKDSSKPMKLVLRSLSEKLVLKTRCHVKGKLLIFHVQGETDMIMNIYNVTTTMRALTKPYTKDGRVYLKAEELKPKLDIGSLSTAFSNSTLFNGDPIFMDTFADTINKNWVVLRDEVEPHINDAVGRVALEAVNKVLNTIPYDKYFKES